MKPIILSDYQCNILRRAVALRDDNTCILCGASGNDIHHLVYRGYGARNSRVIWQHKNMATLCTRCHCEAHNTGNPMRVKLFKELSKRFSYDYNCEPFSQYLIEKGDEANDEKGSR